MQSLLQMNTADRKASPQASRVVRVSDGEWSSEEDELLRQLCDVLMCRARERLVNGYSVSPAKLIMDDDDGSVDMDELVFRPNPVERLEISNSDDDE